MNCGQQVPDEYEHKRAPEYQHHDEAAALALGRLTMNAGNEKLFVRFAILRDYRLTGWAPGKQARGGAGVGGWAQS